MSHLGRNKQKLQKIARRMEGEQAIANEAIGKAVVEAMKAAIEALAAPTAERP